MKGHPPLSDLVRGQVRRGHPVRLVVGGWSMVPLVWPGSRVIIEPARVEEVRPGDLVAVARGTHVVCHLVRAVVREGDRFEVRTRGLATLHEDPPATADELVGKVGRVEWGPFAIQTGEPAFCVARRAGERIGPWLGFLRRAYLQARAWVGVGRGGPRNWTSDT